MTILFYPDNLNNISWMNRLLHGTPINHHNDPKRHYDIFFFWSYTQTRIDPDDFVKGSKDVLNRGCTDITKTRVDQIFQARTLIDPRKYSGYAVQKTEKQGLHDGELVICPCKPEPGFIYQKFIDTRDRNGNFVDYRINFSGQIDFIVKKVKSKMFFTKLVEDMRILQPTEVLSFDEISDIITKCKRFGLDFGELDLLIDQEGNKYIIDVNNIPSMQEIRPENTEAIRQASQKAFMKFLERKTKNEFQLSD